MADRQNFTQPSTATPPTALSESNPSPPLPSSSPSLPTTSFPASISPGPSITPPGYGSVELRNVEEENANFRTAAPQAVRPQPNTAATSGAGRPVVTVAPSSSSSSAASGVVLGGAATAATDLSHHHSQHPFAADSKQSRKRRNEKHQQTVESIAAAAAPHSPALKRILSPTEEEITEKSRTAAGKEKLARDSRHATVSSSSAMKQQRSSYYQTSPSPFVPPAQGPAASGPQLQAPPPSNASGASERSERSFRTHQNITDIDPTLKSRGPNFPVPNADNENSLNNSLNRPLLHHSLPTSTPSSPKQSSSLKNSLLKFLSSSGQAVGGKFTSISASVGSARIFRDEPDMVVDVSEYADDSTSKLYEGHSESKISRSLPNKLRHRKGSLIGRYSSTHTSSVYNPLNSASETFSSSWPGAKQLRRYFQEFDNNDDGQLTYHEYKKLLLSLGFDLSQGSIFRRILRETDRDSSGLINEDEFVLLFRRMNKESLLDKIREQDEDDDFLDIKITLIRIRHSGPGFFILKEIESGDMEYQQMQQSASFQNVNKNLLKSLMNYSPSRKLQQQFTPQTPANIAATLAEEAKSAQQAQQQQQPHPRTPGPHEAELRRTLLGNDNEDLYTTDESARGDIEALAEEKEFSEKDKDKQPTPKTDISPKHASPRSSPPLEQWNRAKEVKWLDYYGIDKTKLDYLANAINLSPLLIESLLIDSKPRAHIYANDTESNSLVLTLHALTIDNFPCKERNGKIVRLRAYKRHRPRLIVHQMHIIFASQNPEIVVTARRHTEDPAIINFWDDLVFKLKRAFDIQGKKYAQPFSGSHLICMILEEVLAQNWELFDSIREWVETLQAAIRSGVNEQLALHLTDLEEILRMAMRYAENTLELFKALVSVSEEPIAAAIRQASAQSTTAATSSPQSNLPSTTANQAPTLASPSANFPLNLSLADDGGGGGRRLPTVRSSSPYVGFIPTSPKNRPRRAGSRDDDLILSASSQAFSFLHGSGGPTHLPASSPAYASFDNRRLNANFYSFFGPDFEYLKRIQMNVERFTDKLRPLMERHESLNELYYTKQTNQANHTLFLLTCITAMMAPVQLITSIYGMNFDDMPELHYDNAYYILMACIGVWFLVMVLWLARKCVNTNL